MKNSDGNSLLRLATLSNNTEMVKLLLDHGADPNLEPPDRNSLKHAIDYDQIDIVRLLLEHGADPNKMIFFDQIALVVACKHGNLEIIDLLLQHGADPFALYRGKTIYDSVAVLTFNPRKSGIIIDLIDSYYPPKEPEFD